MRVYLRGFDILVAEQLLHRADVIAGLQEVGGEAVAERVWGDGFGDAGGQRRSAHGLLHGAVVDMIAIENAVVSPWVFG